MMTLILKKFAPIVLLLTLLGSFIAPLSVSAATFDQDIQAQCTKAQTNGGSRPSYCDTSKDDPLTRSSGKDGIIFRVVRLVAMGVAIISVIMIILGGYTYIISSGDSVKLTGAKNTILYAIIGLVVALSAQLILSFVLGNI